MPLRDEGRSCHGQGASVYRCYSKGAVSGSTTNHIGGLVGRSTGAVGDSYWDVQTSGQGGSAGGLGRTTAAMTHPHAGDTYVDWDFGAVWAEDSDGRNWGYPYLRNAPATWYILTYLAGDGGAIDGPTPQVRMAGRDGAAVEAVADPGAVFDGWSDGVPTAARQDMAVSAHITVTARFRSAGGVPIDWYGGHGIAPAAGEDWSDVDARYDPAKRMTLAEQYIADTDPNDPASIFGPLMLEAAAAGVRLWLDPTSSARLYHLDMKAGLGDADWTPVHSAPGSGGAWWHDVAVDGESAGFFRARVTLP